MDIYISTLPITPKSTTGLGLIVQPFVMDVIGRRLGYKRLLSLGVNGIKERDNFEEMARNYTENCEGVLIKPDRVWRDDSTEHLILARVLFGELVSSGYISRIKTELTKCPCGVVEFLSEAENISTVRRRYKGDVCLVCGGVIYPSVETATVFNFPSDLKDVPVRVFPTFYEAEIKNMAGRFSGRSMLISRSRSSAVPLFDDNHVSIDVDFVWQLFLAAINRSGHSVRLLVGANRNLMACLLATTLLHILEGEALTTIIPPHFLINNRKEFDKELHDLKKLLTKYNPKTIRLLLATSMNWQKKETMVDFQTIDLIQKMSYRIEGKETIDSNIEETAQFFNKQSIEKLLRVARGTLGQCAFEELYGII